MKILGNGMKRVKNFILPKRESVESVDNYLKRYRREAYQSHCDLLVIREGCVDALIAYWLKKRARKRLNVIVVKKDATYQGVSTCLAVGSLRSESKLYRFLGYATGHFRRPQAGRFQTDVSTRDSKVENRMVTLPAFIRTGLEKLAVDSARVIDVSWLVL
ncbi:FAD oxidoreductase [Culex quinquefasciatus]|uniref:FAD oxidoreductase n=1 Tax=Culex quinquefasciatus TaxID=7176 RepID=B0XD23_CULQU|nr:FAD oxidoreductase [Culex quinquefasciatus]|eukprot:XP_001867545.1 FAD oxidoreductase [Culex quinquefasciatus]